MLFAGLCAGLALGARTPPAPDNIATHAHASTSYVSGHETLGAINDGSDPANSGDRTAPVYGNWPRQGEQWVQLEWPVEITTDGSSVYWFEDAQGIRCPASAKLLYREAGKWTELSPEVGVAKDAWNKVRYKPVTTDAMRLVFTGRGTYSTGVLEWRVRDDGTSPGFPPIVDAGDDRVVMLDGYAMLRAKTSGVREGDEPEITWSKRSGPGTVRFENAEASDTRATFSEAGTYVIGFEAVSSSGLRSSDEVRIVVTEPLKPGHGSKPVFTTRYQLDSAFWRPRLRNLVLNWIPHCIQKCEEPDLKEGGLNNLIEAGKKNRGEAYEPHIGYPFSNAWVLNTLEAMCVAQMLDPRDDAELAEAQADLRETIDAWIPILLDAQEPDGYFQTRITLGRENEQGSEVPRWSPRLRTEHEGYVAGYFIEAGIAHVLMTGGKDRRLYDAAKRLADVWYDNIGPAPKQPWYDGHQGMEIALFRLADIVDEIEGKGKGDRYAQLGSFLVSQRGSMNYEEGDKGVNYGLGNEYDQSHAPAVEQYTAVGHAVRAVYSYTAMTESALRSHDPQMQAAVLSIHNNLVNRKYYVTGGIGSGETAEGFGEDYSLPVNSYCESCSGVGEILFQHRLNMLTGNASHADFYEETLYNAVLSDIDLEGQNFTYTNPLDTSDTRYKWHVCPCCVGNIPRALLMLPTWTYTAGPDALHVNLFVGGTVRVGGVGGTSVRITQKTEYPRSGEVSITLDPEEPTRFALHIRVPHRNVSGIYTGTPDADGIGQLRLNGAMLNPSVSDKIKDGYIVLDREWSEGDTVSFTLPLPVQRVHAIDEVASTRGRVALRRGPLVFNVEDADQDLDATLGPDAGLRAAYDPQLLGGVMTIRGKYSDGSPLLAIPNYARNNRGGRSMVWIREAQTD